MASSMAGNGAVAVALQRAREINSKLSMSDDGSATNGSFAGMKRPAQDDSSSATSEKRPLVMDKVAAAAEAAARLNQKLMGSQQSNPSCESNPSNNTFNPNNQQQRIVSAETTIRDAYVGLVIGKKGEQIMQLQSDTGCKVQISQAGTPTRTVTLTGTMQQIERAKQMIEEIIERAEKNGPVAPSVYQSGGNVVTIELMIPGMKAGLIIGKGGETIKSLQEENGVKMVLVQQTNNPTPEDKPLRISGDPSRVEDAKQAVLNLINARDRGGSSYGYDGQESTQFLVPAEKAGLVIGKKGETIKEICRVTHAHVEISKEPSPDPSKKIFNIRGSRSEIEHAIRMISDRAGVPYTQPATAAASVPWGQYAYPQADQWGITATNGATQYDTSAAGMPPPTVNPYTGQPDYSAAWVNYYRQQGLYQYADEILRRSQQQAFPMQPAAQVSSPNMAQPPAAPAAAPVPVQGQAAVPGQYDYNQWQQWQQWQAWQQAMQQPGGAPNQSGNASQMPPGAMPGHPPMPQQ